jgi:hypothetical protein
MQEHAETCQRKQERARRGWNESEAARSNPHCPPDFTTGRFDKLGETDAHKRSAFESPSSFFNEGVREVHPPNNDELNDLLWGATAISDYIGRNYRQTVYLLSTKKLPARKLGQTWLASKSQLRLSLLGDGQAASDSGAA